MTIQKIVKYYLTILIVLVICDFILFFLTFHRLLEKIAIILIGLGCLTGLLLFFIILIRLIISKDQVFINSLFKCLIGPIFCVVIFFLWLQVDQLSCVKVYNNTELAIREIEFHAIDLSKKKIIRTIEPNKTKTIYLTKHDFKLWIINCMINNKKYSETLNYKYFRIATNDKVLLTNKGIQVELFSFKNN